MTFNLGQEEQTAVKDLQEFGPWPNPQVIITAGHQPQPEHLGGLEADGALMERLKVDSYDQKCGLFQSLILFRFILEIILLYFQYAPVQITKDLTVPPVSTI